ncbi:MAG: hypothetical protein JSU85_05000 [Candidatus Zixiibacteriota bacterium]|nr:MAG: hypothetical protein JSU85_05000 [candidate division Zixibacteria bacterium]
MPQKPITENLPATIMEHGLPVIKTNQELVAKVHDVFTPDKFVVLVPKAMNIGENVKIAIQIVDTDDTKDLRKNRDFWGFPTGDDAIMSANLINKLTAKANCRFTPNLTGVVEAKYDNEERPLRVRAQAHCTAIDSLGNLREGFGEYEYNYHEDLANTSLKPEQRAQRRRFAVQNTITGAKKRAFFECQGIDRSITKNDIGKPFVVACVVDDIDYNDPSVKQAIALRSIGAQAITYGQDKAIKADYSIEDEGKGNGQAQEAPQTESQETEAAPEETPEDPPAPEAEEERSPEQLRDAFHDQYLHTTSEERAKKIRSLAAKINHDITVSAKGKRLAAPEEWEGGLQMKWLMWLAERAEEIPPLPRKGRE